MRAIGESIATFLTHAFGEEPAPFRGDYPTTFLPLSTGEMAQQGFPSGDAFANNVVTLLLHRVTISEHLRQARPQLDRPAPLPVQLHYLLTVWAQTPAAEAVLLAWALRALHDHPILDASSLDTLGGFAADEVVHLIPDDISTEDMMRIWDALAPPYRLSFSYVARVVRLESARREAHRPVVVTRFGVEQG